MSGVYCITPLAWTKKEVMCVLFEASRESSIITATVFIEECRLCLQIYLDH